MRDRARAAGGLAAVSRGARRRGGRGLRGRAQASACPSPGTTSASASQEAPGRRLRMQELARRVLFSRSGLTRLVDRMVAAGYVTDPRAVRGRLQGRVYGVLSPTRGCVPAGGDRRPPPRGGRALRPPPGRTGRGRTGRHAGQGPRRGGGDGMPDPGGGLLDGIRVLDFGIWRPVACTRPSCWPTSVPTCSRSSRPAVTPSAASPSCTPPSPRTSAASSSTSRSPRVTSPGTASGSRSTPTW